MRGQRTRIRRLAAIAIAIGLGPGGVRGARTAAAQPGREVDREPTVRRVALVAVDLAGDAAAPLDRSIARSLADGLAGAGIEVVALEDALARLARAPELIGCTTAACLDRIGVLCEVDHVLTARVEARGADYAIALHLYAAASGALVGAIERPCPVCTMGDLGRRSAEVAGDVVAGPAPEAATAAAAPSLDRSPAEGDAPAAPAGRFARTKWWVAGGAVAGLTVGVALVALDGRGTCGADGECERLYDTSAAGWLGIVGGVGLGAAAGWMFHRDRRAASAEVVVAPGGLAVAGRF